MKLHRFYVGDSSLGHIFELTDRNLLHQLTKVLRFQVGREVVLFNDRIQEGLYKITSIKTAKIQLELVSKNQPKIPMNDVCLCFSLLKKDKNDWVLQKCTELGVKTFMPMITDRTEKTSFDIDRANKIVIEAAEQSGRADIPKIFEPAQLEDIIEQLPASTQVFVAEQGPYLKPANTELNSSVAIIVGPEGGWSNREKELFKARGLNYVSISEFTLRAETACVVAAIWANQKT